jgi:hydroxyacylglutathione hydrolase
VIFKRFFDSKLAQTSYLIGCSSTRAALIVDPNRNVEQYIRAANDEGLRIEHVAETHIHADFISGARELSHRTGATLYLSQAGGTEWAYHYANEAGATLLNEGSLLEVGRIAIQTVHTPGHTPEHLAFLVTDVEKASEPMGALTGDFLFVGDVGRPDLLERAVRAEGTMESAARQLFGSLQRFRKLPDYLQIWPGHGAGSACGKSLSPVPQSTLGYEKRFNWAFAVLEEAEFVRSVLAGQPEPPRYFAQMKRINQAGPRLLGEIQSPPRLPCERLAAVLTEGDIVVDTRHAAEFGQRSVPGTLNIPATRTFTTWAGSVLPYSRDLYLIVDDRRRELVEELVRDLAGIGLDRVAGYFGSGVIDSWEAKHGRLQRIPALTLAEFTCLHGENGKVVLDVRGEGEWRAGHIPGSCNLPVGELDQRLDEIPEGRALVVHCQTGSRAAIAASLLRARGFDDVRLFSGGFAEWLAAGQRVEVA